jgi:hypothetical protein
MPGSAIISVPRRRPPQSRPLPVLYRDTAEAHLAGKHSQMFCPLNCADSKHLPPRFIDPARLLPVE